MTSDDSRRLVDEGLARPLVIGGDGASGGNDGNGEQNKSKGKKQRKKKGNRVGSTAYRFHFDATPPPTAQGGNGGNGGNAGFTPCTNFTGWLPRRRHRRIPAYKAQRRRRSAFRRSLEGASRRHQDLETCGEGIIIMSGRRKSFFPYRKALVL
mmetsp:Transcript_15899/g.45711  ORF Transcript_15899/g.45711 Transcript_15899/m.45711 type:complete len:153 (+) Transcript_15899:961-1419(+)